MKRRRVLRQLAADLARGAGCSPAAARAALAELERAGLVVVDGGRVRLPMVPAGAAAVVGAGDAA